MAKQNIIPLSRLDGGFVLAPERYDPRRSSSAVGIVLSTFAQVVSEHINSKKAHDAVKYLVLDTGDAREGVVRIRSEPISGVEIGSAKKRVQPGDVLISRLRPYLRQVALIDATLARDVWGPVELICSTEFFVLRSRDETSIAFLVPFLLSDAVQRVLAAAQEGGHHPRFNQRTLESLLLPSGLIEKKAGMASATATAVEKARSADLVLRALVTECGSPESSEAQT